MASCRPVRQEEPAGAGRLYVKLWVLQGFGGSLELRVANSGSLEMPAANWRVLRKALTNSESLEMPAANRRVLRKPATNSESLELPAANWRVLRLQASEAGGAGWRWPAVGEALGAAGVGGGPWSCRCRTQRAWRCRRRNGGSRGRLVGSVLLQLCGCDGEGVGVIPWHGGQPGLLGGVGRARVGAATQGGSFSRPGGQL